MGFGFRVKKTKRALPGDVYPVLHHGALRGYWRLPEPSGPAKHSDGQGLGRFKGLALRAWVLGLGFRV